MDHVKKRRVVGVSPLNERHQKEKPPITGGIQLQETIDILKPPADCYRFWRDFKNLPHFLRHINSIAVLDDLHSHWVIEGPAGTTEEWDAEIIEDRPPALISWRSLEKSQIDNAGSVHFEPAAGGQATVVKVALTYNPPAGKLGDLLAELFGETPAEQLRDDMELFKRIMESATPAQVHAERSARR